MHIDKKKFTTVKITKKTMSIATNEQTWMLSGLS